MEQTKQKKSIFKRWWFWLIVIVVIGIIGAAAGSNQGTSSSSGEATPSSDTVKEEVLEVKAVDLITAYDENAVAADKEYKDKALKITGTISSIGVDIAEQAYLVLTDENDPYAILGVQCYFGKEQEDTLTNLKEGDTVTLTGRCEGKVINVSVKDCQLAE